MKTTSRRSLCLTILFLSALGLVPPRDSVAGAPSPESAPPPASAGANGEASSAADDAARKQAIADFEADERLGKRLVQVPGDVQGKTAYLFEVVYHSDEPDQELKRAALRRLHETDPRIITAVVTSRLASSPPDVQIGMLEMTREVYHRIGGVDATLDDTMCELIRNGNPEVAAKAIEITSGLALPSAYLPLRELAADPHSPMREKAIEAIGRLRDPRSVIYFKKLLENPGAPKEQIYQALALIGRPSALLLKEKMNAPDAKDRDLACDALITIADGDDLSALYAYIQKYPPQGERKKRIYDAIATIEVRGQERPSGE